MLLQLHMFKFQNNTYITELFYSVISTLSLYICVQSFTTNKSTNGAWEPLELFKFLWIL